MSARRIAAIALSGALVVAGTGAAIAAVTKDDASQQEQAIIDDAAKRLSVTPEKLRDALAGAQDAQLDQAVKSGDLTQKQADAIKARRKQSGRVLGGPSGGFKGGPHLEHRLGPRGGPRGEISSVIAKALGITRAQLAERLHDGRTIAEIAKAEGKSLDDVRSAVKASVKARLDEAVENGDITRKQADAMLKHFDVNLEKLDRRLPSHRGRRMHGHPGGPPPLPAPMRPGGFVPGEDPPPPELALPGTGTLN